MNVAYRICEFFQIKIDDLVRKDLRKEHILTEEGIQPDKESQYRTEYEQLKKQLQTQERLTQLQDQRLAELEREIREQAPELARRLGLDG